uniref:Uncharacterized protein n=1 Tax=Glossina pallidipes TaxID=7398 RepID=A0A1A9Z4M8_GLOPL
MLWIEVSYSEIAAKISQPPPTYAVSPTFFSVLESLPLTLPLLLVDCDISPAFIIVISIAVLFQIVRLRLSLRCRSFTFNVRNSNKTGLASVSLATCDSYTRTQTCMFGSAICAALIFLLYSHLLINFILTFGEKLKNRLFRSNSFTCFVTYLENFTPMIAGNRTTGEDVWNEGLDKGRLCMHKSATEIEKQSRSVA